VSEVTEERRGAVFPEPRSAPSAAAEAGKDTGETTIEESAGTATRRPWRRAFLTGLTTWAAAQAMYLLVNSMLWVTRNEAGPFVGGLLEVWNRWDTGHYVTIALTGYNPATENGAFFPLYPMIMRVLEPVLPGGMLASGLIVAWAACVAALTLIFRLTEDLLGTATAQRTTLYLMAFPFAFYLCAAYNESLFLALAAASLYCMRRQHWWLAGMWAGFASGTRQAGVLLAVAFVFEYLRRRDFQLSKVTANAAAILLVPVGLLAYVIYSAYKFNDPLKFVHIQAFWGRTSTVPWDGVVRTIDQIAQTSSGGAIFQPIVILNIIDLVSVPITITLLVLSVVGRWKLGPESWYLVAFGAVAFLLALTSPLGLNFPPLHGVPRYAIEALPAFMVVARMGANRTTERFYLLPALGVQIALLIAFFNNIWLS
jgi:Gpi18-like mannosyltransferase